MVYLSLVKVRAVGLWSIFPFDGKEAVQHSIVWYSAVRNRTAQYSTVQHSTVLRTPVAPTNHASLSRVGGWWTPSLSLSLSLSLSPLLSLVQVSVVGWWSL